MTEVVLDDVVRTSYGSFTLSDNGTMFDGDADRFFADQANGWVAAAVAGVVHVVLARWGGGSGIRIETLDAAPAPTDAEDVVEVGVVATNGTMTWESWGAEEVGAFSLPAGSYRLRVSAWGRDAGAADEFADGVVDRYLLQFWPAPLESDVIVRSASENAGYWNREWGGRRG